MCVDFDRSNGCKSIVGNIKAISDFQEYLARETIAANVARAKLDDANAIG